MGRVQIVERQIEFEDIDARLTKEPGEPTLRVLGNESLNRPHVDIARARHTVRLIPRRSEADVRVKAARRGGHEVDGNGCLVAGIGSLQSLNARLDRIGERGIERA